MDVSGIISIVFAALALLLIFVIVIFYLCKGRGISVSQNITSNKCDNKEKLLSNVNEVLSELKTTKSYVLFSNNNNNNLYFKYIKNLQNNLIIHNEEIHAIDSIRSNIIDRIKQIKQPVGGYLSFTRFNKHIFDDDEEIIHYKGKDYNYFSKYVELVSISIAKYIHSKDEVESFKPSIRGLFNYINDYQDYSINRFTDNELISLCNDFENKLETIYNFDLNLNENNYDIIKNIFAIVQLDQIYKNRKEDHKLWSKNKSKIEIIFNNGNSIPKYIYENVLILTRRILNFYNSQHILTYDEILYNSELISSGTCDLISKNTVWKIIALENIDKSDSYLHDITLQLIISYLMIKDESHFNHKFYPNVSNIGIFNMYTNCYYVFNNVINNLNNSYVNEIANEIAGLNWKTNYKFRVDNEDELVRIANEIVNNENSYVEFYSKYNPEINNKINSINKELKRKFNQ